VVTDEDRLPKPNSEAEPDGTPAEEGLRVLVGMRGEDEAGIAERVGAAELVENVTRGACVVDLTESLSGGMEDL